MNKIRPIEKLGLIINRKERNELAKYFEDEIFFMRHDIKNEQEMLDKCFILSKENMNSLQRFTKLILYQIKHKTDRDLIMVIGKTGVGKTTFLHYFINNYKKYLPKKLINKCYFIVIDYLDFGFVQQERGTKNLMTKAVIKSINRLNEKLIPDENIEKKVNNFIIENQNLTIYDDLSPKVREIFNWEFKDSEIVSLFRNEIEKNNISKDMKLRFARKKEQEYKSTERELWIRKIFNYLVKKDRLNLCDFILKNIERELWDRKYINKLTINMLFGDRKSFNEEKKTLRRYELAIGKIINYLEKEKKRNLIFIHDNVDRIYSREIEEKVLGKGVIPFRDTLGKFITIMCVRKSTYSFHYHKRGHFDYRTFNEVEIYPISLKKILMKKFEYILSSDPFNKKISLDFTTKEGQKTITSHFKDFINSFFSNINNNIFEFIENICENDNRKCLREFTKTILSGHFDKTNFYRDLFINDDNEDAVINKKRYIPIYEFLRPFILQDNLYYNEDDIHIINIFNNRLELEKANTLIRYRILNYLIYNYNLSKDGVHYITTKRLYGNLKKIGYSTKSISNALELFYERKIIETEFFERIENNPKSNQLIFLTKSGSYFFHSILPQISYSQEMFWDSNIFEEFIIDWSETVDSNKLKKISENLIKNIKKEEKLELERNSNNEEYKKFVSNTITLSKTLEDSHSRILSRIFRSENNTLDFNYDLNE